MADGEFDVVVVGAGAAGLAAGRAARLRRLSPDRLEARERPGGRAWTTTLANGERVDLGCGWLHSADSNPFVAIAEAQGRTSTHRRRRGRAPARRSARWRAWTASRGAWRAFATASKPGRRTRPTSPAMRCSPGRPVQSADRRRQHLLQRRGTGEGVRRRSRGLHEASASTGACARARLGRRRPRRGPAAALRLPRPRHRPQRRRVWACDGDRERSAPAPSSSRCRATFWRRRRTCFAPRCRRRPKPPRTCRSASPTSSIWS